MLLWMARASMKCSGQGTKKKKLENQKADEFALDLPALV